MGWAIDPPPIAPIYEIRGESLRPENWSLFAIVGFWLFSTLFVIGHLAAAWF